MRPLMKGVRLAAVVGIAAVLGSVSAAAQGAASVDPELRSRVEERFTVLPVQDGVVLTPRDDAGGVLSVEIRKGAIAVDGTAVSGAQLRERLGADADLVLRLSYLPPAALANWTGRAGAPLEAGEGAPRAPSSPPVLQPPDKPQSPAVPELPAVPEPPAPPAPPERAWRKTAVKVHIGSSVTVEEDEQVTDPVVAVGGSVTVLGRVDDDVVAVGGGVRLGPHAEVRGDVTAVGGRVEQAPGARVRGDVNEVRFGSPHFRFDPGGLMHGVTGWNLFDGWAEMVWTLFRIGLVLLLAFLVLLVAVRPVSRIADRAWQEPWLSGFVGLLAQLLFVPILVFTVVVLAISIIGIPLLVLVPFGVLLFLVLTLVGFTGVAYRVGQWAVGALRSPFVAVAVGVVLIAAVGLLARGIDMLPAPVWPVVWTLGVLGFLIEYVAWTVGLGAALLTRLGTRGPDGPPRVMPPPVPAAGI